MVDTTLEHREDISVAVAKDRRTASILFRCLPDTEPPQREDVLALLKDHEVHIDETVEHRVDEFVRLVRREGQIPDEFVVAEGREPVEGQDEEFVWDPAFERYLQDWQDDAPIDYYTFNSVVTPGKGETIGTITPQVPGKNGIDVFGTILKPSRKLEQIRLDPKTVERHEHDEFRILAAVPGLVVYQDKRLTIEEVLYVRGDVDFSNGNLDSSVNIVIQSTVRDRFEVKSAKSVTVGGAIEAASVAAEEEVVVRGGILGRSTGRVTAGGEIVAKFCNDADLQAGGNIKIASALLHSRIHTNSKLIAETGTIVGGTVYAKEGIDVATVGSNGHVPTRIIVGMHPETLYKVHMIDEEVKRTRDAIDRIRQSVEPLLRCHKHLTHAQKEQATVLLAKVDEAEGDIADKIERRKLLAEERAQDTPRVCVSKLIYPRTTISIGLRTTHFDDELKGPVSIEKRKVDDVTEFVAVNPITGAIQILRSMKISAAELRDELAVNPRHEASGPESTE